MEELTRQDAEKLLFAVTGKRYRITETHEGVMYPARYMRKSAILGMKNPLLAKSVLDRAEKYAPGVARKMDPCKKNSPVVFDTIELEKWRIKH